MVPLKSLTKREDFGFKIIFQALTVKFYFIFYTKFAVIFELTFLRKHPSPIDEQ